MDITSIFILRTFNKDLTVSKKVETPSYSAHNVNSDNKYGDDWIYDDDHGCWRIKTTAEKEKLKFSVPFVTDDGEDDDNNHMGSHVPDYSYLSDDDEQESWVKSHLQRYEREEERRRKKKLVKITDPDEYIEDTTKYGLFEQQPVNKILTYDDEIALVFTYHKGETYVDKNKNIICIVNRTANYVEFTRNAHLGKLRNEVLKKNRVDFLTMMDFKPGESTDSYNKN